MINLYRKEVFFFYDLDKILSSWGPDVENYVITISIDGFVRVKLIEVTKTFFGE
jgi:hypothetical protein